jgi:hypothetical protein
MFSQKWLKSQKIKSSFDTYDVKLGQCYFSVMCLYVLKFTLNVKLYVVHQNWKDL